MAANLWADVRYAFRALGKARGFTAVAILTLALGIGANTAIFSVLNAVLLRPLPYPEPDRIAMLQERNQQFEHMSVAYLNFLDWSARNHSFSNLAAFRQAGASFTGSGEPERLQGLMVASGFFDVLGVRPVLGRTFLASEDRLGGIPVVILGHQFWKRRFGGSPAVLGQKIVIEGRAATVIGVAPPGFRVEIAPDVFTPIGQWDSAAWRTRDMHPGIRVVGRLRPGVSIEQARKDLNGIARQLAQEYPATNKGSGVVVQDLKTALTGHVGPTLWVLLGAVGFVLLIACVNVANLLLARATVREREMAVRTAIGASRRRLVGQLLTESVILALLGGLFGLLLAAWGTGAALAAVPDGLPRTEEIRIDAAVLGFALVVSIITGLLFGVAPALRASQADPGSTLKETGRGATAGRQRLRDALVVSELALAMILLAGAGLMIRTMLYLRSVDPGLQPEKLLTFQVSMSPANMRSPEAVHAALPQILQRIREIPGIETAAFTDLLPLSGDDSEAPFWLEGRPRPASQQEMNWALWYAVSPDYFRAMRIPLLRGRLFTDHDLHESPPVAIVDQEFAHTMFSGEDPIGKRLLIPVGTDVFPLEIVGVVGHVKHWGLDLDATSRIRQQFYLPWRQIPDQLLLNTVHGLTCVARTHGSPYELADSIRKAITSADRDQPVYNVRAMTEIVAASMAERRFVLLLLGIFGAIAVVLASVGIYGVISYGVAQRTHEIGIRMALGAARHEVVSMVVKRATTLALAGIAVGLVAAILLTAGMRKLLYGVQPSDPITLFAVAVVLACIALAASALPARRAARVEPSVALRQQ